ncbi:MAG: HAMP domain-containing sensor histidine kinase [Terracoccus sp.]
MHDRVPDQPATAPPVDDTAPERGGGARSGGIRPWSAWSLRAKLVASILVLFTVLSLVTGAYTVFALDRQLTVQTDEQLQQSVARLRGGGAPLPGLSGDGGGDDRRRGPGDEGLIAFLGTLPLAAAPTSSVGTGSATTPGGVRTALTPAQLETLSSAGIGAPRDIDLGDGVGAYRVMSLRANVTVNGQTVPGTLVVGLSNGSKRQTVQGLVVIIISTLVGGMLLVALLGTFFVRRSLEPLRRVAATATKVSKLPLDSGQVALAERVDLAYTDTRTEVGQVGAAFNEMLDHVDDALNARHESEQRVRQFVADASHELRTPLASIKGYAELTRRETEPVPGTVTHAMGRIESEATRMSSLVEDLLLLARLDAGRPLERTQVDLSMLVINAVSDAHAASPSHRWDLDLPPEPVEVAGDPARLHQIVANLLANARTHTPEGSQVTTSVRPRGESVVIAVHDNGPGVPQALQANVFERFARGDDARNRAGGSTGLGLSIVAAVAKAHGGRVGLVSGPGDTTFTVTLPAT